jgi:hypothetical protein
MALSTDNEGKRMTRKWSEDRATALVHPNRFTAEELAWLEVTDAVEGNDQNPDMFLIDTQPEDSRTEVKHYDIRTRPEVGD